MQTTNIGQRAASFLKDTFTQTGTVLAVRQWEPATLYEADVLLPATNMSGWQRPQKMNILVAPMTFREYTPAGWDNDIHTCTLYIDAGHDGPGSRWVKRLKAGDTFTFFRPADAHYGPKAERPAVFLGDTSALGHFAALSQIAGAGMPVSGALALDDEAHIQQYDGCLAGLPLRALHATDTAADALASWVMIQKFQEESVFYLMGNKHMVRTLRRTLNDKGISSGRIYAKGFW